MYGININGFKRKTYIDIIQDMEKKAKELFGENIDLSERSPLGLTLKNIAWEISNLWESTEEVYNSAFVDTSEGISLDNTGKYIAVSRKPAQSAVGTITILGNKDVRIPVGFRVSTKEDKIVFETVEAGVIDDSETIDLKIKAIDTGIKTNVSAKRIIEIVNPISGIKQVYNNEATTNGLDTESDKDFRERYYRSVSLGGSSTRESVEAGILNIPNVTDAFVEENETMEYIDDVPPKSLAPYVFGGDDTIIAETILKSKAGGIRSFGTTEIEVQDTQEKTHVIGFTRPSIKEIYINLNITKDIGYPGDEVVKRAVINYIGGTDNDEIEYKGLKLGENVVISKLMASVMCLKGIKDIEVEVSLDNVNFISENLEIQKKEIARTTFDKVVIEYV